MGQAWLPARFTAFAGLPETLRYARWDGRAGLPSDPLDAVPAADLRSVFALTRLCAPAMRRRGWGRVVDLASPAGLQGGTLTGAHYSVSKAGVLVLTTVFAREPAPCGVTVDAVVPAAVETPAVAEAGAAAVSVMAAGIPVGRLDRPAEAAALVAHLVGGEAGYVAGATFGINGGVHMR